MKILFRKNGTSRDLYIMILPVLQFFSFSAFQYSWPFVIHRRCSWTLPWIQCHVLLRVPIFFHSETWFECSHESRWAWCNWRTIWQPLKPRTTDTQWRHKSKKSENLGRCGKQNMLWPYLKIWEWEWIFSRAVKAISSQGVRSSWLKPKCNFCDSVNISFIVISFNQIPLTWWNAYKCLECLSF